MPGPTPRGSAVEGLDGSRLEIFIFNNHPRWFPAVGESLLRAPRRPTLRPGSSYEEGAPSLPGLHPPSFRGWSHSQEKFWGGPSLREVAPSHLLRASEGQAQWAFTSLGALAPGTGTGGPSLSLKHGVAGQGRQRGLRRAWRCSGRGPLSPSGCQHVGRLCRCSESLFSMTMQLETERSVGLLHSSEMLRPLVCLTVTGQEHVTAVTCWRGFCSWRKT